MDRFLRTAVTKKLVVAVLAVMFFLNYQINAETIGNHEKQIDIALSNFSPEVRQTYKSLYDRLEEVTVRSQLNWLVQMAGFTGLSEQEKIKLMQCVGCALPYIGRPARKGFQLLLDDEKFISADSDGQIGFLKLFLEKQDWLPLNTQEINDTLPVKQRISFQYTKTVKNVNYNFQSKISPSLFQEITFPTGETLDIYFDTEKIPPSGISAMTPILANSFAAIPASLRKYVRILAVTTDMKGFMSARGRDNVLVFFKSQWFSEYDMASDFMQQHYNCAFFHECGHLLTENLWGTYDERLPFWISWKEAVQEDGLYPSRYGRIHLTDDMAEMFSLFLIYGGSPFEQELRSLFPSRMRIVDQLLAAAVSSGQVLTHRKYDSLILKENLGNSSQWEKITDSKSEIEFHPIEPDKPGLKIDYALNKKNGWVVLRRKLIKSENSDVPIILSLKGDTDSDMEIKFISTNGSVFGTKFPLKDYFNEWGQVVIYQDDLRPWGIGKNYNEKIAIVEMAFSGQGQGTVWIKEIGFGATLEK